jgi:hypothetical protein
VLFVLFFVFSRVEFPVVICVVLLQQQQQLPQ